MPRSNSMRRDGKGKKGKGKKKEDEERRKREAERLLRGRVQGERNLAAADTDEGEVVSSCMGFPGELLKECLMLSEH